MHIAVVNSCSCSSGGGGSKLILNRDFSLDLASKMLSACVYV